MRFAGRAAMGAVAALLAGLAVSFLAAVWLRSATPGGDLVWRVASPAKAAVWTLAAAHAVPIEFEAKAGVTDERIGRIGERIGELFGREETPLQAGGSVSVRLVAMTVLLVSGLVLVLTLRTAEPLAIAVGAGTYGVGLALLGATSQASLGFEGRIVSAGMSVSVPVGLALVAGVVWGAVFAVIAAIRERRSVLAAGVWRAVWTGAIASIVGLAVVALSSSGRVGSGDNSRLAVLGVVMLGVNAVVAGIVLAHGAVMNVALDAGPLSGFTRLGYFPEGSNLPATRWVFVIVPIVACLAAGLAMRRRLERQSWSAALSFGVVWAVGLVLVGALLHVSVASNFSIASLAPGGTATVSAGIGPLVGLVAGTLLSYAAMAQGTMAQGTTSVPVTCSACGAGVPAGDAFCGACGARIS